MARAADPEQARAAALRIVKTLRSAGFQAHFAGGCVRDELLGLHPTDYDVATDARPEKVRSLFRPAHLVGEAFGVILVPINRCAVEVATFRGDGVYSDSRRPDTISFGDIHQDAARRDFTINALYLDPDPPSWQATPGVRGRVIDLVGGVADLHARMLRAVGDPDQRLAEDHLRALRAVRFAARLSFTIDPATRDAIQRCARELRGVSRERIGQELQRMLEHPARASAAAMLQELSLDAPTLDEPHAAHPLPTLIGLGHGPVPYGLALAAWALDRHAPDSTSLAPEQAVNLVRTWRRSLCLSNADRDLLADTLEAHDDLIRAFPALGVAKQKRFAARPAFELALALLAARDPTSAQKVQARRAELSQLGPGVAPDPLISGDDLISLGLKPGPGFKRLLDVLFDAQLEGRIKSRNQGLSMARELAADWGV